MDFFQGSTPLNFIPFCLKNYATENSVDPTTPQVDNPDQTTVHSRESQAHSFLDHSPHSQDSEPDVTAYAESVIRRKKSTQEDDQTTTELSAGGVPDENQSLLDPGFSDPTLNFRRSSTPISPDGEENTIANLSAFECALNVATISLSQLPELRPTSHSEMKAIGHASVPTDDDTTSSVQDAPSPQVGQLKVRFLPSQRGGDSSAEETSQFDAFELYMGEIRSIWSREPTVAMSQALVLVNESLKGQKDQPSNRSRSTASCLVDIEHF